MLKNMAPLNPASEKFKLSKETEAIVKEGLEYIGQFPNRPFEERARMLTKFLEERGVNVERDKRFGDVLVTSSNGWGVVMLFNEEARIKEGRVVWNK
ncbi:hypothetical protein AC480_01370 [miscellaneous Crenarchaeota group archaeon SMTZ1-55]|nr:MAG: hypothetical protein AC480_01370 [miscellaneous Crenarchaeota group archaeon SMTZ1-55]